MSSALRTVRMISLLFLLAGIGGYIVSTVLAEQALVTFPQGLVLAQGRMIPREIHGTTIYLTREENRRLNLFEYSSMAMLLTGATLGFFFWTKLSQSGAYSGEDDSLNA